MKTIISASAFVVGILLVGVGQASSATHFLTHEQKPVVEKFCANFPPPSFCKEGTRIIVTGVNDDTGCAIYSCKKVENNELNELEQKLKEIYNKIKELKQEAEELHKLIAKKRGNNISPPRRILPPQEICTMEYAPVCAIQEKDCPEGMYCTTDEPAPRTFSNRCEAKVNKAKILYNGACNMGTKEIRIKRSRNIHSEERSKMIFSGMEEGGASSEARQLFPQLQKKMLPLENSVIDSSIERAKRPIKRSSRWNVIMDFLRR